MLDIEPCYDVADFPSGSRYKKYYSNKYEISEYLVKNGLLKFRERRICKSINFCVSVKKRLTVSDLYLDDC